MAVMSRVQWGVVVADVDTTGGIRFGIGDSCCGRSSVGYGIGSGAGPKGSEKEDSSDVEVLHFDNSKSL